MESYEQICERVKGAYEGKFGIESIESTSKGLKIKHKKYLTEETRKAIADYVKTDIKIEYDWV